MNMSTRTGASDTFNSASDLFLEDVKKNTEALMHFEWYMRHYDEVMQRKAAQKWIGAVN